MNLELNELPVLEVEQFQVKEVLRCESPQQRRCCRSPRCASSPCTKFFVDRRSSRALRIVVATHLCATRLHRVQHVAHPHFRRTAAPVTDRAHSTRGDRAAITVTLNLLKTVVSNLPASLSALSPQHTSTLLISTVRRANAFFPLTSSCHPSNTYTIPHPQQPNTNTITFT
jgi:hypothetical protein